MSHVGFADSYEPPYNPPSEAELLCEAAEGLAEEIEAAAMAYRWHETPAIGDLLEELMECPSMLDMSDWRRQMAKAMAVHKKRRLGNAP